MERHEFARTVWARLCDCGCEEWVLFEVEDTEDRMDGPVYAACKACGKIQGRCDKMTPIETGTHIVNMFRVPDGIPFDGNDDAND